MTILKMAIWGISLLVHVAVGAVFWGIPFSEAKGKDCSEIVRTPPIHVQYAVQGSEDKEEKTPPEPVEIEEEVSEHEAPAIEIIEHEKTAEEEAQKGRPAHEPGDEARVLDLNPSLAAHGSAKWPRPLDATCRDQTRNDRQREHGQYPPVHQLQPAPSQE